MQDILLLFQPVKVEHSAVIQNIKDRGFLSNFSESIEIVEVKVKGQNLLFLRCVFFGLVTVCIDNSVIIQTKTLDDNFKICQQILQLPNGVNFLEIVKTY